MSKLKLLLLGGVLLLTWCLPMTGFAAGGDYVWPPYVDAALGNQEAKASKADSQGNLILVGSTDTNGNDIHIVKVLADGSGVAWRASKDGNGGSDVATAVTIDSNDDILVTGYLWDGTAYNDIYTAKYAAADGTLIWEHIYDGDVNGHDYPTAIAVDDVGNVFVTGYIQNPATKDDIVLLKYGPNGPNPDGTPLWEISYDAGNDGHDRAYAIVADDVHGVAVTGESQNTTSDFDCLTVKYDTLGNQVWVRRYADSGDGRGEALAMDSDGNVVMAGYVSNGSDQDFYVTEYAADDSPANWVDIYDSGLEDHATAIWLDGNDDVYVAGDDATLTTGSDIRIAKYDGVTGVKAWSSSYNSSGGYHDMALDLVGDPNGELFVVGYKNDAMGGLDDVLAMKVKKDDGTQLWLKEYDGVGKADRSLCACLIDDGNLLVGGWTDRWTTGSNDYDFLALKFESGALNGPTSLLATVATNSQINLSWKDNATGELNYIVERKIGTHGSYTIVDDTLPADSEAFTDTGLTPDTRYFYRVVAYSDSLGHSPYSNEANEKTTIVSYDPPSLTFQYGAVADGDDYAEAIAVGPDNHPVVTGFITGSETSFDYYTIKLDRTNLTELWSASYNDGDNEVDIATAITVDSSNRVVVSGFSSLFYPGGTGNTNDIYTIGYPADGSVESWTDQYNGPDGNDDRSSAVASAIDGSDSTVVVGYGKNDLFNDDIYVIKYLFDGTLEWAITPYDSGGDDYPAAVAFDSNGDVLVGGYTSNASNKDFFVAKYSGTDGSEIWQKSFNGPGNGDDVITALAVDAAGNLYVTGHSVNASGNSDIYTIKYAAADGTLLWEQGFNGAANGYDSGDGIVFDPVDGNILVGGTTFVGSGNHDFQLIRYAADGTVEWEKTLDRPLSDEALYGMSIDGSGNLVLTGTTFSAVNDDVLTVKYDSDGIIIGASVYNGAEDGDDVPSSIVTNAYGETFVAGFTTTAGGDTDYMVFMTDGVSMQAPFPFTATQLYTRVDLSWSDRSINETGFDLERKVGSCDSENPWSPLYTLAANTTSYSDTGLNIGSTYCYRIRSFAGSGDVSRWVLQEATTNAPVAPSSLLASPLDTSRIELAWADNTQLETGFTLERCSGAGCDFTTAAEIQIAADATSYIDTDVCPGQVYSYRIKAYRTSEWSTAFAVAPDTTVPAPVAPVWFTVTRVSETQVDLTWTEGSIDESGFSIERCTGSGCSNFAQVATQSANQESYSDTGLAFDTLYRYRVTPYKDMSCTQPVMAYTSIEETTTTITAPSGLTADAVSSTKVILKWSDGTASEDGFKIERCQGSGCEPLEIATVAADSIGYIDDTVCSGGGEYRYRVRAYQGVAWDTASAIAGATVSAQAAPHSLTGSPASEVSVALDWDMEGYNLDGFIVDRCEGAGCTPVAQRDDVPMSPVLVYSLDEPILSGTDAVKDRSGNANHGTGVGLSSTNGQYNGAAQFDSPSHISTPILIDQTATGKGATFEAWIYPSDTTGVEHIISTDNGSYDWSIIRSGSAFRIYNGAAYMTYIILQPNVWQHIMAIYEPGAGTRFYHNGTLYSHPTLEYETSVGNITIGNSPTGASPFNGKIDEVMVYDRPLTHEEVLARYNGGNTLNGTLTSSYTDENLTPNTTYGYQVRSYSLDDCAGTIPAESANTAVTYVTTLSPPPPTDLTATIPNSTQVDLTWSDNTDSETGFVIERCPGTGTACDEDSEFSLLVALAADSTGYSDMNVCADQPYTYRVAAEKDDGPNWTTNWAVLGQVTPPKPATPFDFTGTPLTEVLVALEWTDNITDESGYELEKCLGSGTLCDEDTEFSAVEISGGDLLSNATMWFKFDETSWGTPINSAGGNNAYNSGTVPVADAERGRVAYFDGSDYMRVYNYPGIQPIDQMTVSVWAKSYSTVWTGRNSMLSKRNAFTLGQYSSNGFLFQVYINNGWRQVLVPNLGININQWHLYTGTYDGSALILYVDGVEVGRTNYSGTINADTGYLYMGHDDGYGDRYRGYLDDAIIYTQALSVSEVLNLFYDNDGGSSQLDDGLIPDTTYTYRLRAYKDASCDWWTDWRTITVSTSSPPAPTSLAATPNNTTSVTIGWQDKTVSETEFTLERCTGSGSACDQDSEFSPLAAALPEGSTSYNDTTVCESSTYSYRVRAESSISPIWQTTWAGPISGLTPGKTTPTNLTVARASEIQLNVSWADSNSDETGFELQRCSDSACSTVEATIPLGANVHSYADSSLQPNQMYYYRVRAYKTATCSWWSDYTAPVSGFTTIMPPDNLTANPLNTTRIDLSWTDNSAGESQIVVERCAGNGCSDYSLLAQLATNTTSYSDTSVSEGQVYSYRVRAERTTAPTWETAWTAVTATTPSIITPTGLAAVSVSEIALSLSWSDGNTDETGFELQRCSDSACTSVESTFTLAADETTYVDNQLQADQTYYYRVRAFKTATNPWQSDYTATVSGIPLLVAPSGLGATPINTTRIDVNWTDTTATETQMVLERCAGSGCSDFSLLSELGPNVSSYSDTSVCNATTYNYRVKAKNTGVWETAYSNADAATTMTPTTPTAISAIGVGVSQVDIAWSDTNSDESGFEIEYCSGNGCSDFVLLDTVGSDIAAYSHMSAPASTHNNYRVRARKDATCAWTTGPSNTVSYWTLPAPASNLTATALNSRMINLCWDDNASDEDGYEVETQIFSGDFVKIADLPANTSCYVDTRMIDAEAEYRYRVRPYRASDTSVYSGVATTTTPPFAAGDGTCTP